MKKDDEYVTIKTAKKVEENNIIEVIDGLKSHNLNLLNETPLFSNISQANPKDNLQVQFSFGNTICKPFKGMIVLALSNEKDEWKYILYKVAINNLKEGYYYPSFNMSGIIPEDISNGDY